MAAGEQESMDPRDIKEMGIEGLLIHSTLFNEHLVSARHCARCQEYGGKQDKHSPCLH